jgi:hypothetical protein
METQPNPEGAATLWKVKERIPADKSANHELIDYLIHCSENSVPLDTDHVDIVVNHLIRAHLETTLATFGA